MKIKIFDVEHGNCALITTPNGKRVLIDCGHNETTGFRPSNYLLELGIKSLNKLVISNVDQDHISDLKNIHEKLGPIVLMRNKDIGRNFLNNVKEEITDSMESYLKMHEKYTAPASPENLDFGDVEFTHFSHKLSAFDNTNDLSIVTFIKHGAWQIVFPGDLSKNGWLEFLKDQNFRDRLANTKVFVASHHGREDGYCPEVFEICKPSVILISDKGVVHETQKDVGYSQHTDGLYFTDGQTRKVITTRNNGVIDLWSESLNPNGYNLSIQQA